MGCFFCTSIRKAKRNKNGFFLFKYSLLAKEDLTEKIRAFSRFPYLCKPKTTQDKITQI